MERKPHKRLEIPTPLPVNFEGIPKSLQSYTQWVLWQYCVINGELKKPPFSPKTGGYASVTNPATWGSFAEAKAAYETGQWAGVGLVLRAENGIVGIDIDHCIDNGHTTIEALIIIAQLDTYTTISASGTGLRLFLYGSLPGTYRRSGNIEMYQDKRYLTLTGHQFPNTPANLSDNQEILNIVYHYIFHENEEREKESTGRGGDHFSLHQSLTDDQILQKAYDAKNGEMFRRYYEGDQSLWEGEGKSQSSADFTLCLMLLYWTNGDDTQVDRLFRKSGLMRAKWDRRTGNTTYGALTIERAKRIQR